MAEQKRRGRKASEAKRKPGNPSWIKGGPSPNPHGRPRAGLSLAERIRERFDPDLIVDLALQLASDDEISVERRLSALLPFVQLGYLKPPTTLAATLTTSEPKYDVAALPIDEQRKLLDLIRRARAALPDGGDGES